MLNWLRLAHTEQNRTVNLDLFTATVGSPVIMCNANMAPLLSGP